MDLGLAGTTVSLHVMRISSSYRRYSRMRDGREWGHRLIDVQAVLM